jgi:peptide/nickel transport system ATP-binding protein
VTTSILAPLEVRGLTKHFAADNRLLGRRSRVHAVDDVTFVLRPGTITALVGESGSGKSTVARLLARLYAPTGGSVFFEGSDVTNDRRRADLLRYRSQVQMIFQDPFASLNPVKTIRYHLTRPLKIHERLSRDGIEARLRELLETVGLVPVDRYLDKYPHELSGGQRQRVAIARALAVRPSVLVADEPTSMLDVSIRAGILNLMLDLKERERLAFLYVTHDLASARYVADTVLVMYAGQIVEQGPTERVLAAPLHPYTRLLLASVPDPASAARERIEMRKGLAAAAVDPPEGCRFVERCPLRIGVCSEVSPELVAASHAQSARCHVTSPSPAIREDNHVEPTH